MTLSRKRKLDKTWSTIAELKHVTLAETFINCFDPKNEQNLWDFLTLLGIALLFNIQCPRCKSHLKVDFKVTKNINFVIY